MVSTKGYDFVLEAKAKLLWKVTIALKKKLCH